MPFCMKLAQRPLAQSVFIVRRAEHAPMPSRCCSGVLDDVAPVLDVVDAPLLPPDRRRRQAPASLAAPRPLAPVVGELVLSWCFRPQPAAMIPIPLS
jgi:hypothetical protein